MAELSGREKAATWFLHYIGSGLDGSFFPPRHCPCLKYDPGLVRKGLSAFRPADQRAVSDMQL